MPNHTNQQRYRFSAAPIWEIQRAYYEEKGLKAWNNDQVPQYITSNPMIASAYANMIFGFLQDRANMGHTAEPVYIVELGAGAGRLAYHVLHELCQLREYTAEAAAALPPFRYVMTDLASSNVLAWQQHPALQPYVTEGLLDFARFDAVHDVRLELVSSGITVSVGELAQPLVVVANYVFDSLPQELLYMRDGQVYETDVIFEYPEGADAQQPTPAVESLEQITFQYANRRAPEYEEDAYPYRDILSVYREELEDEYVLFPAAGIRCLERLNQLSQTGFLLITADKGEHLLDKVIMGEPPELVLHGSFSLMANYHALQHHYLQKGAAALFPPQYYENINVGCILHADKPADYLNLRLAYRNGVERFGPDEFYLLKTWVDRHVDTMGLQELLGFWRLGAYDAEFFIQSAKRFSQVLPEASDEQKEDLLHGIERMWSSYYPMEQRYDLALDAGLVLFEMERFEESKLYLERSVAEALDPTELDSIVFYCLAICCFELDEVEAAKRYLQQFIAREPQHEEALALMSHFTE